MLNFPLRTMALGAACIVLTQCGSSTMGSGNMGGGTVEERNAKISNEPTGDFYYGRRYYVEKTRFWGYLRKPRENANRSKLVVLKEDKKLSPDRLSEDGPSGQRYGYDNNYEYRLRGYYLSEPTYEPNSNQFLPTFMLTGYEVVDRNPGWLFRPDDRYDRYRISLVPR